MREERTSNRVTLIIESQTEALLVEDTKLTRLRQLHNVPPTAQLAIDYGKYRREHVINVFTPLAGGGYVVFDEVIK